MPGFSWARGAVQKLSPDAEFAIVLLIALGLMMISSVLHFLWPPAQPPLSEAHLHGLLVFELLVLGALALLLRTRGWTLDRLGIHRPYPMPLDILIGIALFLVTYAAIWICLYPVQIVSLISTGHWLSDAGYRHLVAHDLTLPMIVLNALTNPIYEEVFVCAYILAALQERRRCGPVLAAIVSIAVRSEYHLYQGWLGVFYAAVIGTVFAWWFTRNRSLWPLIVAHGLYDFTGLLTALQRW